MIGHLLSVGNADWLKSVIVGGAIRLVMGEPFELLQNFLCLKKKKVFFLDTKKLYLLFLIIKS